MAETKPVQSGNRYEVKKQEKQQKKKEKNSFSLPKARRMAKNRNAQAQWKQSNSDMWNVIGMLLTMLLVAFILLGGISQRKFVESIYQLGLNWGQQINQWFNPNAVFTNSEGIYIDPDQLGQPNDTNSENTIELPEEITPIFVEGVESTSDPS